MWWELCRTVMYSINRINKPLRILETATFKEGQKVLTVCLL
jgi:hypothetical protein